MSQASILFLSTQLPFPPKSGGTIKSWHYLKDLSNRYEMGIGCLLKDNDNDHLDSLKDQLSFKHSIFEEVCVPRNLLSLLRSYLGHPCLNVFRNFNSNFQRKIKEVAHLYDAIIVDHYEVYQYVPENYPGKVILHTHNAEFELWERMIDIKSNPLIKLALKLEARRVVNYERKILERSDLVYATPSDIESYKNKGIKADHIKVTFHLGNDELLSLPNIEFEQTNKALVFMGTLSWEPNIDGLLWFINEVYPKLLGEDPDIKLYVLGKEADDRLKHASASYKGIELCGFVEDIDSFLKISRVFIAPLRFGSGMKVKVLEGMYRGIPIVTTNVGAEGLEIKNGEEMLIADDPMDYAHSCLKLLREKDVWERISQKSRKKAAERYTWQPLFESMDRELRSVL